MVAWESSQNLGTPPLVSPQNDVWKWLQKFHTGNVLCHHPDLSSTSDCNFPSANDQSEALPRSWYWHLNSMKFLQSFLRRHFTGQPVMVLKNVGCFLRLSDGCSVQLMQGLDAAGCSHVGRHRPRCRPKQLLFSQSPFIWRKVVMSRRDISLQNVVNCLREKQKVGPAWRLTRPAGREGDRIAPPSWFCTLLKNATTCDPNIKGGVSRKFTQIHPLRPTWVNWSPNWAWDVLITAFIIIFVLTICREGSARREGGKEVPFLLARPGPRVSLAPKTPFPFPSKRLPRRLHFPQITHAADSRPAW